MDPCTHARRCAGHHCAGHLAGTTLSAEPRAGTQDAAGQDPTTRDRQLHSPCRAAEDRDDKPAEDRDGEQPAQGLRRSWRTRRTPTQRRRTIHTADDEGVLLLSELLSGSGRRKSHDGSSGGGVRDRSPRGLRGSDGGDSDRASDISALSASDSVSDGDCGSDCDSDCDSDSDGGGGSSGWISADEDVDDEEASARAARDMAFRLEPLRALLENWGYDDDRFEAVFDQRTAESCNNGGFSITPPHGVSQRESMQILQPASAPTSPLASPNLTTTTSTTFSLNVASCSSETSQNSSNGTCSNTAGNSSSCLLLQHGQSTVDPNWQATKPSVRERNAAMFNNELMADVRFVVGNPGHTQCIPAHKYVLATGSSVFYAMFYGGLAEDKEEIEVPDVEPSAFLTLLRYLYCDEIQLEADTVLATLYVAKKYIVPHLARACVNYLETSLTAKNACLLLSQSRLFEEPDLMQRCWEVIDAQAEMALRSEGFVDIDMATLESVFSRETLNCKEMHLFEAALNWAGAECLRKEIDPTPENKRAVLGTALFLIRLPTMSLEDFANSAAQLGVLTPQETIDIFLHFTAHSKPLLCFPTRARAGLKPQVCHRFQSCAYRSNQWRYRGRCDSIQFSVDKRIFVVGFGLYGSSNGAADYTVKIELKRLGRVLAEHNTKFFSDGSSNTFHVYFEHPIQVEPESYYTASAILDGVELSYFGQEGMSEAAVGAVTFQFQCSSESTNGTGVQGGQIPELIFYGPTQPPEDH